MTATATAALLLLLDNRLRPRKSSATVDNEQHHRYHFIAYTKNSVVNAMKRQTTDEATHHSTLSFGLLLDSNYIPKASISSH
jgi:hypothetical protein